MEKQYVELTRLMYSERSVLNRRTDESHGLSRKRAIYFLDARKPTKVLFVVTHDGMYYVMSAKIIELKDKKLSYIMKL